MDENDFNDFYAITRFQAHQAQRRYKNCFCFFPCFKKQLNFGKSHWKLFCKKGVVRFIFAWEFEAFWIVQSRGTSTKLGALLKVSLLAWDIEVFWIIIWRTNSKQPGKIRYCILVKIYIFSWYNMAFLCAISLLPQKKAFFFLSCRSSRPEVFCKNAIFRNFTKFTGKHLRFFNKVAGLRLLLNSCFLNRGGFHFTCSISIS